MAGHVLTVQLRENTDWGVADVGPRRRVFDQTVLVDLTNPASIEASILQFNPTHVVNCVGVLVKNSEDDKIAAIRLNGLLPHLLEEMSLRLSFRLIHLSTDCVFSGHAGPYRHDAYRDGDLFYDRTKAIGELAGPSLTIRTSIVGPELSPNGTGLLHWYWQQKGVVSGYSRALWSGVTTLELARFVQQDIAAGGTSNGVIQFSVAGGISKFELLALVRGTFGSGATLEPSERVVLDKRLVPHLNPGQPAPRTYREQIADLAAWMRSHPDLYKHYQELHL
jgi:dTDP-4-dehydrorhamnose reductase